MQYSRRIRFDGADSDWIYFSTPSWSRPKSDTVHTIVVCKRTGEIRCTCEDAEYRRKVGDILEPTGTNCCKHGRSLLDNYRRILENETERTSDD